MYSDLDKLINSVANRVKTPAEARNLATTAWLAADDAGLAICNLKPLAYNLKCEPDMNSIMEAVRVLNMRCATTGASKHVYTAIAQALNRERTEFDTLDELLEELRASEAAHSKFVDSAIEQNERMEMARDKLHETLEARGPRQRELLDEAICLLGPKPITVGDMPSLRYGGKISDRLLAEQPTTHTLLHAGELYLDVTILLHTEQLVAWRTADGQEYSAKAHRVMLDPDEDGLAAALLTRIAGVEIAPEHMAELRAQMAGGVTHG